MGVCLPTLFSSMQTELYLNITPNNTCKSFTVKDISFYNENLPVTCGQLEVSAPGFSYSHTFEVSKDFDLTVNMSNLGLIPAINQSSLASIPDGNYSIKYSINPNAYLYVEYNYYSVCQLYSKYVAASCKFLSSRCDLTKAEQSDMIDRLFEIVNLIEYAKISAEECDDIEGADALYKEAENKLKNVEDGCKTCR